MTDVSWRLGGLALMCAALVLEIINTHTALVMAIVCLWLTLIIEFKFSNRSGRL